MSAEVEATLDLSELGLLHGQGGCARGDACDGRHHPVIIPVDLGINGLHCEEDCPAAEDTCYELGGGDALQDLHAEAHPDGALFAENCREMSCRVLLRMLRHDAPPTAGDPW